MAGGGVPAGAAAVLLCVLAVTSGAVTATVDRTADGRILFGLLAFGQLVAHVMLTVVGHTIAPRPVVHRPLRCSRRTRLRWSSGRH